MAKELLSRHRHVGRSLVREVVLAQPVAGSDGAETVASPNVTVFRCLNCSRPASESASTAGRRPSQPEPEWPMPVHDIVLPCTGRLQPEHLLKAFEAGADAVCVVACGADSCHYLEGSRRVERRVGYVRELLDEIGLGADRLTVLHLAASGELGSRAAEMCEMVMAGLGTLQPNPLREGEATV